MESDHMTGQINYHRIRNVCKSMTDFRISSDLLPAVEKFLIQEINILVAKAKELMKASKRKVKLYRSDFNLNERYLKIGKVRKFTNKEIRNLILENLGNDKQLQNGVVDLVRGYLLENLKKNILKVEKVVKHSRIKKTMKAEHWQVFFK